MQPPEFMDVLSGRLLHVSPLDHAERRMIPPMRRFEFSDGSSNKFWQITRDGTSLTVTFGKIGTAGQTQLKELATEAAAIAEHDKLVKEKTKKGYAEVGAVAPAPGAAPVAAAAAVKKAPKAAKEAEPAAPEEGFVDAGKGYSLGLRDGKLVCKNDKGKLLSAVPKEVKDGEVAERLIAVRDFLAAHAKECEATAEGWMLRSLPTPAEVLAAVWSDATYKEVLENLIVAPVDKKGAPELDAAGFLKGASAERGVGVVDLDGETKWHKTAAFFVPHPILLGELDEWRGLAAELGLSQGTKQLFREVFAKPTEVNELDSTSVEKFRGGEFEMLAHARGAAKALGYRVSGGWTVCRVFDPGSAKTVEARFWIGADDPMSEAYTENLVWVSSSADGTEKTLSVRDVPPIAFSEGMRMASALYGKRKIEKKEDENA
jgi:predicted DNA-binding WGR domain protein